MQEYLLLGQYRSSPRDRLEPSLLARLKRVRISGYGRYVPISPDWASPEPMARTAASPQASWRNGLIRERMHQKAPNLRMVFWQWALRARTHLSQTEADVDVVMEVKHNV